MEITQHAVAKADPLIAATPKYSSRNLASHLGLSQATAYRLLPQKLQLERYWVLKGVRSSARQKCERLDYAKQAR